MLYAVEVKETLSRTVLVKADSLEDGIQKVNDAYRASKIILTSDDFVDVEICDGTEATEEDVKMVGGPVL